MRCSGTSRRSETFWDPPDFDVIEKFVEYCDHFGFDVLHTLGSVWDFGANRSRPERRGVRPRTWDVTFTDSRQPDEMHRTGTHPHSRGRPAVDRKLQANLEPI